MKQKVKVKEKKKDERRKAKEEAGMYEDEAVGEGGEREGH